MRCPFQVVHPRVLVWLLPFVTLASPVRAEGLSGLGLGLRGRYMADALGQTELLAMVEVGTNLDAVGSSPPANTSLPTGERPAVTVDGEGYAAGEPGESSYPDGDAAEEDIPPQRRPSGRRDEARLMRELERCPLGLVPEFVTRLMVAVSRSQGLDASRERLESQASRARTQAWLPDLRLRAGRDVDQSLRLSPTTEDPYRYTQSGGISYVYEATVGWRLGRLVFAGEEPGIERIRLSHLRERERLRETVLPLVFRWQEALCVSELHPGSRGAERQRLEIEIELDLLSGGWFSVHRGGGFRVLPPRPPAPMRPAERRRPPERQQAEPGASGTTRPVPASAPPTKPAEALAKMGDSAEGLAGDGVSR